MAELVHGGVLVLSLLGVAGLALFGVYRLSRGRTEVVGAAYRDRSSLRPPPGGPGEPTR